MNEMKNEHKTFFEKKEEELKIQLIKSAMENYPEAGRGNSLSCVGWNYKKTEFYFFDEEADKRYFVNLEKLKKGFAILLKIVEEGKYFNNGVSPNFLSRGYDWDAQDYDALVQCAIFGDVLYG